MSGNMMSAPKVETGLTERLVRLTGDETPCSVAEYEGMGKEIRGSKEFSQALMRARALSDEKRLLALALLRRRKELCACEIQAATGLNHATVSHHMAVLGGAGYVRSRRKGKWMYYSLTDSVGVDLP